VTLDRSMPGIVRWCAVGVLAAFLVAGGFTRHPHDLGLTVIGGVVAVVAASAVTLYGPRAALVLGLVSGAGVVVAAGSQGSCIGWFGLCVLAFCLTVVAGPRLTLVFVAASEAVLLGHLLAPKLDLGWLPWVFGVGVSFGGAALLAHERKLISQLRAAQAGLAERSRAEERNRIARDLHDVIAHSLTVSLLHIASARLALQDDPEDAARALEQAERLGRNSLDEVRSIVGLMRTDDVNGHGTFAPVQGLESLDDLVDRFRGAGAEVEFEPACDVTSVPATASTTLFRIAQEAFTNAAKHAPGQRLSVRLTGGRGRVELIVDSEGAPGTGHGTGLESMRERAEAVGGSCQAGPANGGWRVQASVPVKGSV
jgi:signal transduction histidine kinase